MKIVTVWENIFMIYFKDFSDLARSNYESRVNLKMYIFLVSVNQKTSNNLLNFKKNFKYLEISSAQVIFTNGYIRIIMISYN